MDGEGDSAGQLALCQRDSYLRSLATVVTTCSAWPGDGGSRWAIELAESPMFPEGGGQPCDTGVLRPASTAAEVAVLEVRRQQVGCAA